jgi:hypothetical protein
VEVVGVDAVDCIHNISGEGEEVFSVQTVHLIMVVEVVVRHKYLYKQAHLEVEVEVEDEPYWIASPALE